MLKQIACLSQVSRPIIEMFWVAEYNNGQALSQLDPFRGIENSYSKVDHKNTLRLWWLPVTLDIARIFPFTRHNPLLRRHCVELKGSKGFIARRTMLQVSPNSKPRHYVGCYVLGIEGGPRREIYPDGSVIDKPVPDSLGETQEVLHG